mmetsp:Transcript_65603/g.119633  ORF Transcript_65603/g.119633 Transcript_65603/m.119633 type:complete len:227 (-) Transcript_65603:203-883(-)
MSRSSPDLSPCHCQTLMCTPQLSMTSLSSLIHTLSSPRTSMEGASTSARSHRTGVHPGCPQPRVPHAAGKLNGLHWQAFAGLGAALTLDGGSGNLAGWSICGPVSGGAEPVEDASNDRRTPSIHAIAWRVFPKPMSSASMHPKRDADLDRSQCTPSCWWGFKAQVSGNCLLEGLNLSFIQLLRDASSSHLGCAPAAASRRSPGKTFILDFPPFRFPSTSQSDEFAV